MADNDSRAGIRYTSQEILSFVEDTHLGTPPPFASIFSSAKNNDIPEIMLGRSEAKLVSMMLRLIGAQRVVEIGTLAGYSAAWLASAVGPSGHVYSCEFEAHHAHVARENLARAGVSDRVTILEGAALQTLPTLEQYGPFDAVFIDADKENYDAYGRWAATHTRSGGLLLGDNSFLFGELMSDSSEAQAMRRFHSEACNHYDTVNVPTPDGMLVGIRK